MTALTWENESGPRGVGSTSGSLTHSLDYTEEGLAMKATHCTLDECTAQAYKAGKCYHHHTISRFRAFVAIDPDTGCWLWQGHIIWSGYGHFGIRRPNGTWGPRKAHRVAYELFVGPIPDGLALDHRCEVRACVNPDHLTPATARENTLRNTSPAAENARRTTCRRGHPLAGDNLQIINAAGGVKRRCKACARARRAARSAR